jgi:hypothetical protein
MSLVTNLDPYAPIEGMHIWVGRYYRRVVTVLEELGEDRWKVEAYDPREDRVIRMALTINRPVPKEKRETVERHRAEKLRLTPELRQKIEDGSVCRAKGHDLTTSLPNGKPALYLSPNGQTACRWCKLEAAERHKNKLSKKLST